MSNKRKQEFPKELEQYGLKDVQLRKEYFRQKAAASQSQADEYNTLADRLDSFVTQANKERFKLSQQGMIRLDGKTAQALIRRGLGDTCGIITADTKLLCRKDVVELQPAHWAPAWVADMVDGLKKAGLNAQQRAKFYDTVTIYKDDPEGVQSEAGLLILERQP
jgi:hypothetical protein